MNTTTRALQALDRIREWPIIKLGSWPTPVERYTSDRWGEFLVKRDDLSGFGRLGVGGIKARKLEGFLGHMRQHNYDSFVMPLTNMTNMGHDIFPPIQKLGLRGRLLIVNRPYMTDEARQDLFKDIVGRVELAGPNQFVAFFKLLYLGLSELSSGNKTMLVPPSPAHPASVIGVARGFLEMIDQQQSEGNTLPSMVFLSAASGTSLAGFVLASNLLRTANIASIPVIGIPVSDHPLRLWLPVLIRWTLGRLDVSRFSKLDLRILNLPENIKHGRYSRQLEELCVKVKSEFGLEIDPLYGGKTWNAMDHYLSNLDEPPERPAMFWHCGFTPTWQALRNI